LDSERINRWLSLAANIGVVVGIIFLAIEIRQNTEMLRSEASVTYAEARTDAIRDQLHNDRLLGALHKARNGTELDALELLSLQIYYRGLFVMWNWEYGQYADGLLYSADRAPEYRWKATLEYYPHMRESWDIHKGTYSQRFVDYMERNVLN
jgi:hypothetical protein